ncbi:hypothetical protein EMM73_07980 [Rheinheimera sediminis]|uniref:hypothetical protein n=1 Tax=Rheinheimera sp. YQF-1 TaxID=2499626 RepID=UPI000FD90D4F|nr:hypothetical protein [Rheinheimera sp. YQF-1]RVT46798.1 hypothetical protein EMM73_07980 [Rheinheimera sp. YQF-1]
MIAKSYIERSLKLALKSYNQSTNNNALVALYSKFAILELCGWIEISMDNIIIRLSKKMNKDKNTKELLEKVKRNSSFDYDSNFKPLVAHVIGMVNFEKVESRCDLGKLAKFEATLSILKKERNKLAHTDLKNISTPIPSPSIALAYFSDIYEGLIEMEKSFRYLKHI